MRCGLSVFQWSGSSWFHWAIARRAVKVTAVLTLDNFKTFGNAICMRAPSVYLRKSDCAYLPATRTPKIFNPTVISVHPINMRLGPPVFSPELCHNQTNPLPAGSYPPRNVASDRSLVYTSFGNSPASDLDPAIKTVSTRRNGSERVLSRGHGPATSSLTSAGDDLCNAGALMIILL
jgi:hypothetical protein